MITLLTDIEQIDRTKWAEFVREHPDGCVFQTPEFFDCWAKAGNEPSVFVATENKQIVGVLVSVLMREKGGLKGRFSARSIIIGGPLAKNDDHKIVGQLLKAHDELNKNRAIYAQIRNQSERLGNCDTFRECGYTFEPHLNYLVATDNADDIWKRIGKGRIKQIKKAINNGLKVEAYTPGQVTDGLIEQGYEIISEVYRHANLPLTDVEMLKQANNQGLLYVFAVRNADGEMLGCRFGLGYKKSMYGWYAGSFSRYYSLFPNDILIWETLKWLAENGFEYFDYGGAGSPNKPYGVRSFKSQMGGRLVDFGRFEKVYKPKTMKFAKLGFNIYRKLFKFNK